MADLETVKARIRALRAKTVRNGCTEEEAMAAAAKVVELLHRHGLAEGQEAIAEEEVRLAQKRRPPLEQLFGTVAWVCHCRWYYRRSADVLSVVYLGRDPWPEVAAYLHSVVAGAAGRAARDFRASASYKARRTTKTRAAAIRTFLTGFAAGLSHKLLQLKRSAGDDAEQRADLVLAMSVKIDGLRPARPQKPTPGGRRYSTDLANGFVAGGCADVAWGVAGRPPAASLTSD